MKPKSTLRSFLAITGSSLFAISYSHAAILYWDGGIPAGAPGGGTGTWDLALTNWDNTLTADSSTAWVNANLDTAVFGHTAGTVTLGDDITVGGLTFNTTAYSLASDTGTRTLSFGTGDNTILFNNIAAVSTSSGATAGLKLGGTGNVILSTSNPLTAGTLTLQYSVASDFSTGWSGSTTINAGMTLALAGRDLSLSSTSGITLNGGGITLTNSNNTQGAFNRVKDDAGITSNGGTITYNNTNTGTAYAETLGTVALTRGQLNIVSTNAVTSGTQALTFGTGSLTHAAANTSAITFAGASLGLNAKNTIIVTGQADSAVGGIIGPWATWGTTAALQTDYATYNRTAGGAVNAFGIQNAAITATAEGTWGTGANVTLSGATTLTGTRTLNSLRYTGGTQILALGASNFNLETYGLLNGGSGTLTVSTAGTGALTTPTGGGNLYLTTGNNAITVSAPINDNGGAVTVVKSGSSTLTLSSTTSNFTGGVVLNAGALTTTSNANLGIGGGVTVNGIASWNASTGTNRSITINEGGVLTLTGASNQVYSGLLSGSGALASNTSNVYYFTNTGNSLSGEVTVSYGMFFGNITDSSKTINIGNTNSNGGFGWIGGAKTLSQRVIALNAAGSGFITNNGSGALVIEQDLAITGAAGARTFTLQGTNSGANTFSGDIADGTSGGASVVGLSKGGTGTWALGGTNTYSGVTDLVAASGRLIFQGSQSLSSNTSSIVFNQTSSSVQSISLLDDGAGTINFNKPLSLTGTNTSQNMSIFVGNNNTANGGSSAGATTGSTIQVGAITHTLPASDTGTFSINVTGANNYRLRTGTITLNNLTVRTAAQTTTTILNPTTANMTVDAITMATGNVAANDGIPVIRLAGTSTDNIVTGAISNATDFATGHVLSLEKQGISTWTLQGTNTYTGTTAISVGKMLLSSTGSLHASSAVTVSGGALGGTGTVNGTVTVSSTGGIDLRDNAVGNLTLASTLGITGAANANNLSFDLGNGTGTSDSILVTGTTSVTTANSAVITLNQLNGVAGRNATTYTLIGGAGTLDATNFAKFTLATTKAFGQTYALANGGAGGDLQLTTTNVTSATAAAFWAGGGNNWSTTTNWRDTLAGGGAVAGAPDYQTNVTFSTTTPTPGNLTTNVLDVDFDINSLTLTNASGNVTIGGTKMLTLEASGGTGIDSQKTTGTNTISSKVALASSQSWTVASGGTLTVSGVVSDFGGGYSLTKAGLGDLNLSGVNTYSGATNITAGILRLDHASALAGTSGVSITSGASLFVRSVSPTLAANQSLTLNGTGATGTGALVISTSGTTTWNGPVSLGSNSLVLAGGGTGLTLGGAVTLGSSTLTLNNASTTATTISGAISGSGGLIKQGAGTGGLVLTGANTYTGTTAIEAGLLSLNPAANTLGGVLLATSAITLSQGATLQFNVGVSLASNAGGYSLAAPITLTGGAGTASLRSGQNDTKYVLSGGVTGQSSVAQTLAIFAGGATNGSGDRGNLHISGAIADGASGGTLAVTVDFAGASGVGQNSFVNLSGQNTFTGNLIVNNSKLLNAGPTYSGGWLTIGGERWAANSGSPGSLETIGTGYLGTGGVYNGNITINTGNGINGTGITTLSFLSSANQTLGGAISGAGNLRQDGTGTLKLTGSNNYAGTTVVSAGTMQFTKQASLYNNTPASWTAGNINVKSGAAFAVNVDDAGTSGFTDTNLNTLLTNISVAGSATVGLQAGAILGFDTSTDDDGTFTQGNAIANSTGANGGAIGVTKLGTGTLVFDETNTYTGATAVNAGKLLVLGSIGGSTVMVNNAGTILATDAAASFGSTVGISTGAILAPGDAGSAGTATVTGATTFSNGSIFSWDIDSTGTSYDKLVTASLVDGDTAGAAVFRIVASDATFAHTFWDTTRTWTNIFTTDGTTAIADWDDIFTSVTVVNSSFATITPVGGSFSASGNTLTWTAVPEPTTALAGLLLGAGLLRRRRI